MISIVETANAKNSTTLVIPAELTEKLTDNTTIQVMSYMNLANGMQGSNSVHFVIEPFVYTIVGNYSYTYSIYPADGLPLSPAFFYPECPNFKGPASVPISANIGCNLYDSKNNWIKALSGCQIKPNEI
jgi:hypothetical protein